MAWSMWARRLAVGAAALACLCTGGIARADSQPMLGVNMQGVDFLTPSSGFEILSLVTHPPAPRLYRTSDGGKHWIALPLQIHAQPPVSGDMALPTAVSFASARRGALLVTGSPGACQNGFAVDTTTNGGQTWQTAGWFLGADGPTALAAAAGGPAWVINGGCAGTTLTLYAAASGRMAPLHRFVLPAAKLGAAGVVTAVSLQRLPSGEAIVVAAYGGGASAPVLQGYASSDHGATWRSFAVGGAQLKGQVSALGFDGTGKGLALVGTAGGAGTLYRTSDGGKDWSVVAGGSFAAHGVQSITWANSRVVYVLSGNRLWQSSNAGASWQQITQHWPS